MEEVMGGFDLARQAAESLYYGRCTIVEFGKVKVGAETRLEPKVVEKDIACRLSGRTYNGTGSRGKGFWDNGMTMNVDYVQRLFLNPDVEIKLGSRIIVEQDGVVHEFEQCAEPARYKTHQSVDVRRVDKA